MIRLVIRDQVFGDIEFTDNEMKLIRSASFERLRYIKQLGFAEFLFPGAVHTRYQHSLGVCACVTQMYEAVCRNDPSFYREGDLELLRMMALCHDMGHAPFSHASEDLSDIPHEQRLKGILKYEKDNIVLGHTYGVEPWDLVSQVYLGKGLAYIGDSHLMTLHSFLDGAIDADKLDYLARDALNCGVAYGNFDRQDLISNLTIVPGIGSAGMLGVLSGGIQALESFILARYYMFSKVYFSPEERLRRMLYCGEVKLLLPDGKYPNGVRRFLALDDTKYIRRLKCLCVTGYELVYDAEYDDKVYSSIREKLSDMVVCDVICKSVFRGMLDDPMVYVVDPVLGTVLPCVEASPLLKAIEYMRIHKLRCYAKVQDVERAKEVIRDIVKAV